MAKRRKNSDVLMEYAKPSKIRSARARPRRRRAVPPRMLMAMFAVGLLIGGGVALLARLIGESPSDRTQPVMANSTPTTDQQWAPKEVVREDGPMMAIILLPHPETDIALSFGLPRQFARAVDPRIETGIEAEGREVFTALWMVDDNSPVRQLNLSTRLEETENAQRVMTAVDKVPGSRGIVVLGYPEPAKSLEFSMSLVETAKFSGQAVLTPVLEGYLGLVGRKEGIATGDMLMIPGDMGPKAVYSELAKVEKYAQDWGTAIVGIPATQDAINILGEWKPSSVRLVGVGTALSRLRTGVSG